MQTIRNAAQRVYVGEHDVTPHDGALSAQRNRYFIIITINLSHNKAKVKQKSKKVLKKF